MIYLFTKRMPLKLINYGKCRSSLNNNLFPIITCSNLPKVFFHSSCYQMSEIDPEGTSVEKIKKPVHLSPREAERLAYWTVDWLPFPFKVRQMYNPFEESGDIVKTLEYDPSWPKPGFELSDELKTATDDIKHRFSLATASKGEIKEVIRRRLFEKIQRHPNDFDSLEVTIAKYTITVRSLLEHKEQIKKERRGGRHMLYILINKRNKYLNDLYKTDLDRFNWICKELKLEYKPKILGGIRERYTKKWDLRRLTKEYCAKLVKDKKDAYHEELKRQQTDFLKEKEEALMWMENEKEKIANITEEIAKTTKELENLAV